MHIGGCGMQALPTAGRGAEREVCCHSVVYGTGRTSRVTTSPLHRRLPVTLTAAAVLAGALAGPLISRSAGQVVIGVTALSLAAVVLARVIIRPVDRLGWALIAAALLAWATGYLGDALDATATADQIGAQVLWHGFYALIYAGVLVITWRRAPGFRLARSLDALIVALSLGGVAAALLFALVRAQAPELTDARVASLLAYPISDVVILIALVSFNGRARDSDPLWRTWATAIGLLLVADTGWLVRSLSTGNDLTWILIELAYGISIALLAFSAWLPDAPPAAARLRASAVALPVACGVLSVAVVLRGLLAPGMTQVGAGLALGALAVAVIRLAVAYRDAARVMGARLRFAEQRREAVQQGTADGVWRIDVSSGEVMEISEAMADLLGVSQDAKLTRSTLYERVHPDDRGRLQNAAANALEVGGPYREEVRLAVTGSAQWRSCVIAGHPVMDVNGRTHLVGTVHDLTDLRRAEAQRVALARDLHDSLAQDVAISEMYARAAVSAARGGRPADTVQTLELLVGALSDADQRVRLTLRELRGEPVDGQAKGLRSTIVSVVEGARRRDPRTEITIIDTLPDGAQVSGPALHAAENVLREALTNALKHARAARLDVKVCADEQQVTLQITDDGIGFVPAERDGRFGLCGMRERGRDAGGDVTIRSAPGDGTTVIMTMPLPAAVAEAHLGA